MTEVIRLIKQNTFRHRYYTSVSNVHRKTLSEFLSLRELSHDNKYEERPEKIRQNGIMGHPNLTYTARI